MFLLLFFCCIFAIANVPLYCCFFVCVITALLNVDVSVVVAAYVADVSSLFLKIMLILFVLLIFLSLLLVVAVVVVLMYISIHFLIFLDPCSPKSDWPCAPPVLPYTDYGNGKLRPEPEFAFTSHIFLQC